MSKAKKARVPAHAARKDGALRNDETVARNMRRFRIARGLSQTELGNAVGVTFQQIQKYEKAKNAIAPGFLALLPPRCSATSPRLTVSPSRR
jgi:ribosome-binding protein aMBF1 (putative translation factor)